jgi:hypothetical protein
MNLKKITIFGLMKDPEMKYTTINICCDNIHTFSLGGCFASASVIVRRCLLEGAINMQVDSGELLYPEYYQFVRFQDSYELEQIKD